MWRVFGWIIFLLALSGCATTPAPQAYNAGNQAAGSHAQEGAVPAGSPYFNLRLHKALYRVEGKKLYPTAFGKPSSTAAESAAAKQCISITHLLRLNENRCQLIAVDNDYLQTPLNIRATAAFSGNSAGCPLLRNKVVLASETPELTREELARLAPALLKYQQEIRTPCNSRLFVGVIKSAYKCLDITHNMGLGPANDYAFIKIRGLKGSYGFLYRWKPFDKSIYRGQIAMGIYGQPVRKGICIISSAPLTVDAMIPVQAMVYR